MAADFTQTRIDMLRRRWQEAASPHVSLQLADLYRQRGSLGEAVEVLEGGLSDNPESVSLRVALGRYRMEAGDAAAAAVALRTVVDNDPSHLVANKLLVKAYVLLGERQRARDRLDLYALLNDSDPEIDLLERSVVAGRALFETPRLAQDVAVGAAVPFEVPLAAGPVPDLGSLPRPRGAPLSRRADDGRTLWTAARPPFPDAGSELGDPADWSRLAAGGLFEAPRTEPTNGRSAGVASDADAAVETIRPAARPRGGADRVEIRLRSREVPLEEPAETVLGEAASGVPAMEQPQRDELPVGGSRSSFGAAVRDAAAAEERAESAPSVAAPGIGEMPFGEPRAHGASLGEPDRDEPVTEAPGRDWWAVAGPATDAPPREEPHRDAPPIEEPDTDALPIEEPATDAPPIEEPATDAPPVEEPDTDEAPIEEPDRGAPPIEEPATDAPPREEPDTDAPPIEEPDTAEPPIEAPVRDGAAGEMSLAELLEAQAPEEPEAPRPTLTLARLYLAQGHLEEAEATFHAVLLQDPGSDEARLGLAAVAEGRLTASGAQGERSPEPLGEPDGAEPGPAAWPGALDSAAASPGAGAAGEGEESDVWPALLEEPERPREDRWAASLDDEPELRLPAPDPAAVADPIRRRIGVLRRYLSGLRAARSAEKR